MLQSISNEPLTTALCLHCGVCCDGTLFKDVELQPRDDGEQLRKLGMPLRKFPGRRDSHAEVPKLRFTQPCAALCADLRCKIYAQRPAHCRAFECALFKSVAAGRLEASAALRAIRLARQRAERVRQLLAELGDTEIRLPLSVRFRRLAQRMDQVALDEAEAGLFGELTLAFQDLNVLLSREFYPSVSSKSPKAKNLPGK